MSIEVSIATIDRHSIAGVISTHDPKLLPRDSPLTHNCYDALVTKVKSPETQENVDKADEHIETAVAIEHFTFSPVCCITHFYFSCIYQNNDWLFIYSITRGCKPKCSRKKTAQSAGCLCRNADKKCSIHCRSGQKLQCKNGKNEATERENAQITP